MDTKRAPMREIAKVAGVSLSTVFRVMNGGSVSESARAKVLSAAELLKQRSSRPAGSSDSSYSLGIILPSCSATDLSAHPSMFTLITSFLQEMTSRGISCAMNVFDDNDFTVDSLLVNPCDGYLVLGTSEDQEAAVLPGLSDAGIPVVVINRDFDMPHVSNVNVDDQDSCMRATEYLISLGHRNIAFVGGNKNYQNTRRRLMGYELAMRRHQLPVSSANIFFGEYSENSGYQKGRELLALPVRPTAALFASDPIAIGCMRCLTDNGLHLPEDFSAIGFGDIDVCQYVVPALTTIAQPSRDLGLIAAQTLIQLLEIPIISSQKLMVSTDLKIRASVCPPKDLK